MDSNKSLYISLGIATLAIVAIVGAMFTGPGAKYDGFAQCLGTKGATFYGAFWCPHCQNTKALFGSSAEYLPYVECSESDGKTQTPICKEKNINNYPHWTFADGSVIEGEVTLQQLAEKTQCELPQ